MEGKTKKSLVISRILVTLGTLAIAGFLFLAFGPNIERRPLPAYESGAAGSLLTIYRTNAAYAEKHPQQGYALGLTDLGVRSSYAEQGESDLVIDDVLASGQKGGYKFTYSSKSTKGDGKLDAFQVTADPLVPGKTGKHHFFVDQTGVIRMSDVGPADSSSEALQ